jgi:hypothetical protein
VGTRNATFERLQPVPISLLNLRAALGLLTHSREDSRAVSRPCQLSDPKGCPPALTDSKEPGTVSRFR